MNIHPEPTKGLLCYKRGKEEEAVILDGTCLVGLFGFRYVNGGFGMTHWSCLFTHTATKQP